MRILDTGAFRDAWVSHECYPEGIVGEAAPTEKEARAEFEAWLEAVKRDAAREALDGLVARFDRMGDGADQAGQWAWEWHAQDAVEGYRNHHYPKETP